MTLAEDILLLSTYELGHQPLGLASPLGFLARAGHTARALDLAVESLDEAAVARARFVGISVPMHTALRLGVQAARRVRELNPDCHICFYGLYAPLHRDYLVASGLADSVIGGEYEAELLRRMEASPVAPPAAPREVILDRLSFAVPERTGLPPLAHYARLSRDGREHVAGYVEASRGCLHRCRHCPIPAVYGGRFFVVPVATVLEDIRRQVTAGAEHVTFGDPDFWNGPEHALAVVRALHREFPSLSFDVTTKIEHILRQRRHFAELKGLGCAFLVSAVESLSDRVLRLLDKGHTRADVEVALDIVQAAGLPLRPSLLPFTPWSTLDDYFELLDWVARRGLWDQVDPIQMAIRLLIPPGSKLLELDEVRRAIGPLDEVRLTYTWVHPDPRMDALQRAAYGAAATGSATGEDPRLTLHRIRVEALTVAGCTLPSPPAATLPRSARPPRLTEAWFC